MGNQITPLIKRLKRLTTQVHAGLWLYYCQLAYIRACNSKGGSGTHSHLFQCDSEAAAASGVWRRQTRNMLCAVCDHKMIDYL